MNTSFTAPAIPHRFFTKIAQCLKAIGYSQTQDEDRLVFVKKGSEVYFRYGKSQYREWLVFSVPIVQVEKESASRILSYLLLSNFGLSVQVEQPVHFVIHPQTGMIELSLLLDSEFVLSEGLSAYLQELVENLKELHHQLDEASKLVEELIKNANTGDDEE